MFFLTVLLNKQGFLCTQEMITVRITPNTIAEENNSRSKFLLITKDWKYNRDYWELHILI